VSKEDQMKVNPERLKRTYAVQGKGVFCKERSQKEVDIWRCEVDDEESPVPESIMVEAVYEPDDIVDAIEYWNLCYNSGCVVKYVADHANTGTPIEDLKRAQWHLSRLIGILEER